MSWIHHTFWYCWTWRVKYSPSLNLKEPAIALLRSKSPNLTLTPRQEPNKGRPPARPPRCAFLCVAVKKERCGQGTTSSTWCGKMKGQQNLLVSHTFLANFAISRSFGGPQAWNTPIGFFIRGFQWGNYVCSQVPIVGANLPTRIPQEIHSQGKVASLFMDFCCWFSEFWPLSAPWQMICCCHFGSDVFQITH